MYQDDELLPISALQHLLFCERQCALIHIEGVWLENARTVEGRHLHERAHGEDRVEVRGASRTARGLQLRSRRLGLAGVADIVEFHLVDTALSDGVRLPGLAGTWHPYPVEYKRGRPKAEDWDRVQLCAQALCLEEMLNGCVNEGALFYGTPHRRTPVAFDARLRATTLATAERLHILVASGRTPPPVSTKRCDKCSLVDMCLPSAVAKRPSALQYMAQLLKDD